MAVKYGQFYGIFFWGGIHHGVIYLKNYIVVREIRTRNILYVTSTNIIQY